MSAPHMSLTGVDSYGGNSDTDADDSEGMARVRRFTRTVDDDGNVEIEAVARCNYCKATFEQSSKRDTHIENNH